MGDVITGGGSGPGLFERWYGLPARIRRPAAALAVAAVLAGIVAGHALTRPRPGPPPAHAAVHRVPYPVHSTRLAWAGLDRVDTAARTFRVGLRVDADDPVLVRRVTQTYDALEMELVPPRTVVVRPGRPVRVWAKVRVNSCHTLSIAARHPFLEVTLCNARAAQEVSFLPGRDYARTLTRTLRTLCGPSAGP